MRVGRFLAMACAFAMFVMVTVAPGGVAHAKGAKPKARPRALHKDDSAKKAGRPQNLAPRGESASERQLQDDLDAVLAEKTFTGTRSGVYVVDMNTGKVLYSYAADSQLNPASNVKLVTTAAALDALGPDFAYRTRLLGATPDLTGSVQGDVWLVGMADPTLSEKHLNELAGTLRAHGVTRVTGSVVVSSDPNRDVLGRARLQVSVDASGEDGELTTVTVSPESAYVVLENRAVVSRDARVARKCKTVRRGKGRQAKRQRVCGAARPAQLDVAMRAVEDGPLGPHVVVTVTGKLRPGTRYALNRYAPHPAVFTGHAMRAHMKRAGITVEGGVRIDDADVTDLVVAGAPGAVLSELAVHDSVPLAELVARVNKPSNNELADRVAELTGGELFGEATVGAGVRAMNDYMGRLGINDGSFLLENGSGLSYRNHLSVRQIAGVLMAGLRDDRIGAPFFASMAIAGKDGTLRGRFRGAESRGYVFAKTGTLTGVAALSGYVTIDDGGHVICFAIVSNGYRNSRKTSVRAGQARLVEAMYRYLRRGEAARDAASSVAAPAPPGAQPAPSTMSPMPDLEDEDEAESDAPEGLEEDELFDEPMPSATPAPSPVPGPAKRPTPITMP